MPRIDHFDTRLRVEVSGFHQEGRRSISRFRAGPALPRRCPSGFDWSVDPLWLSFIPVPGIAPRGRWTPRDD
jgi:hypothetical protein